MKIYISASIINVPFNERIATTLESAGYEVFLPQRFCPVNLPHESYPDAIFKQCVDSMEACDMGILMLDSYERDSSWECGWFESKDKPIVGLVTASLKFLQDWMIKGGLEGVITTDRGIYESLLADEILRHKPISLIDNLESLGEELKKHKGS